MFIQSLQVSSSISEGTRTRLESEFDEVVVVDVLNSNNDAMLTLLKRPELGVTLTKVDFTFFSLQTFLQASLLETDSIQQNGVPRRGYSCHPEHRRSLRA